MSFSIIISEKGGAERRETFDKNEINVGRVQGNDLMLPKGNVSKHHARLLYRDGRFIVTDLKSTNGTYVNGRKIAQATIVREGDKIYIGDFVLRLDSQAGAAVEDAQATPGNDADRLLARTGPNPNAQAAGGIVVGSSPRAGDQGPTNFPNEGAPDHGSGPDVSATAGMPKVPAPPRMPSTLASNQPAPNPPMPVGMPPIPGVPGLPAPPAASGGGGPASSPGGRAGAVPIVNPSNVPTRLGGAGVASSPMVTSRDRPSSSGAPSRVPPRESPQQAARRLALVTLVDRVADATDLTVIRTQLVIDDASAQRIERAARDQAAALQRGGELPDGTDVEQLVRDAMRELLGFGPIQALLDDEEVTEIHCLRHDHVLAVRGGVTAPADPPFTSDEALARTIWRLAAQSGEPVQQGERIVERRLSRGAHLMAVLPPAAASHAVIIRKRRRLDMSLEDFVRLGGLSRAMATFLENCIVARTNVLVCGPNAQTVASFLAAFTAITPPGDRVAVLQEVDELTVPHAHVLSLALADTRGRGEEVVRAAAKARPNRLVVTSLVGNVAAATLEAVSDGVEGVMGAMVAPTLRQGISRLVAQTLLARPGMSVEAARECVGESFDIAVEVTPLPDGRSRVLRLAELGGTDAKGIVARDLFTSSIEGPDGNFAATGVVPRVVGELSQRGVRVDPNLFKRSVGRPS